MEVCPAISPISSWTRGPNPGIIIHTDFWIVYGFQDLLTRFRSAWSSPWIFDFSSPF